MADDPEYREILNELTRLWRMYKDCIGEECSVPLPSSLRTSAAKTSSSTKDQREGVLARYGHTF